MDNKQLKKVFEFIATMLEDETDVSSLKKVAIQTELPIENTESVNDENYYDLPNSLSKLSKKYNLDIDHIRDLIRSVEAETAKKAIKYSKENEISTLRQEMKKLKEQYEEKISKLKIDGLKDLDNVDEIINNTNLPPSIVQIRTETIETPQPSNGLELKDGKLTYTSEVVNPIDYGNFFVDASLND